MPRDFGDWLGDHKPMDFNDPGALPSSKPAAKRVKCDGNHGGSVCGDPECWQKSAHLTEGYSYVQRPRQPGKTTAQVGAELVRLGFKYHPGADCFKRHCASCAQPILVSALQCVDYLKAHYTFSSDPCKCLSCNGFQPGTMRAKPWAGGTTPSC